MFFLNGFQIQKQIKPPVISCWILSDAVDAILDYLL